MDKITQRKICLQNRNALSKDYQIEASNIICDKLLSLINKEKVLSYMPTSNEVDVSKFNKEKDTAYPTIKDKEILFYKTDTFIENKFHIYEPDVTKSLLVDLDDYDYIVVPLVGFDESCHRLGHGGGYYDRFLKNKKLIKIGVGFESQKQDLIVCDNNDVTLDYIISEKQIYKNRHSLR